MWSGPRFARGPLNERVIAMAFADPFAINNLAGSGQTLPRVTSGDGKGVFKSSDGTYEVKVQNTYGRRNRHEIRYTYTAPVTDPLIPAQNVIASMSCIVAVDVPPTGFTNAQAIALSSALFTALTASTNAKLTSLVGGEN